MVQKRPANRPLPANTALSFAKTLSGDSIRSFVSRAGLFFFVRLRFCEGAVAPNGSPRGAGAFAARLEPGACLT
jgi:hypothetical protein